MDKPYQLVVTFLIQHTILLMANMQHPIIRPPVFGEHGCCPIIQLTTGWLLGDIQHFDNREHTPSLGWGHHLLTYEVVSLFISA